MKNLRGFLFMALAIAFTFAASSCKKCDTCVKECQICHQLTSYETICNSSFSDHASYQAEILYYENSLGYTCGDASETDEVCTSGFLYKVRHKSDIDAKESEGFDCN